MSPVLLSLGGNLGEPVTAILSTFAKIHELDPGAQLSTMFRTAPLGYPDQPDFINACVTLQTTDEPATLLGRLLGWETEAGRIRQMQLRNRPRPLDIDMILYGTRMVDAPGLQLPHPRFRERRFVLVPAVELAADWRDPVSGKELRELLAQCPDHSRVEPMRMEGSLN